jgi:hypothetical protein
MDGRETTDAVRVSRKEPRRGEVVEWLMAPASKADRRDERLESSNLSLSARFLLKGKTQPLQHREVFRVAAPAGGEIVSQNQTVRAAAHAQIL